MLANELDSKKTLENDFVKLTKHLRIRYKKLHLADLKQKLCERRPFDHLRFQD